MVPLMGRTCVPRTAGWSYDKLDPGIRGPETGSQLAGDHRVASERTPFLRSQRKTSPTFAIKKPMAMNLKKDPPPKWLVKWLVDIHHQLHGVHKIPFIYRDMHTYIYIHKQFPHASFARMWRRSLGARRWARAPACARACWNCSPCARRTDQHEALRGRPGLLKRYNLPKGTPPFTRQCSGV